VSADDAERARHRAALEQLPAAYAAALRLRADGASDQRIAEQLEIEVSAVPTLLAVATAKLRARLGEPPTG
jgi:DNA-directed RNA polymerase specialized sigma24 family protein